MSYTRFEYRDIRLSAARINADESLLVSAWIKNSGLRAGDEVVQLYVQDVVGSITRPVKELRGFKRITLAHGDEAEVTFALGTAELGFFNAENVFVVEPGTFRVWIGPDSAHGLEASFTVEG
jgi:beta-glucosidase